MKWEFDRETGSLTGRLGVQSLAMMCADNQWTAQNEGRPPPAAGEGSPASSLKAPIGPDHRPGLGTLPRHKFCALGLSIL